MTNWKKEAIIDKAQELTLKGFRVFIAESGEYGFFTDKDGLKVVSFQFDYSALVWGGNYKAKTASIGRQIGSGWRISDDYNANPSHLLSACAPHWAASHSQYTFTTLEQYLSSYSGSRYTEYKRKICQQPVDTMNFCK